MANRYFSQFFYTLHKKPVLIDCSFKVAPADTGGKGVSGLIGPGIAAVYMNTSSTPTTGNPNPAAGNILVQLQDNYAQYLGGFQRITAPTTGGAVTTPSAGVAYTIGVLGTTTLAQWQASGLPVGIIPKVGAMFIGNGTLLGGSGSALAVGAGNCESIELCGPPGPTLTSTAPLVPGVSSGAYLIFQCMKNGSLATPTTNSVIHLSMYFSNSYIQVQGS